MASRGGVVSLFDCSGSFHQYAEIFILDQMRRGRQHSRSRSRRSGAQAARGYPLAL